jgi:hypothetical protein
MLPGCDGEIRDIGVRGNVEEPQPTFNGIKSKFGDNRHVAGDAKGSMSGSKKNTGYKCLKELATIITVSLLDEGWYAGGRKGRIWMTRV